MVDTKQANFCGLGILFCFAETNFCKRRTHWFFSLRINFCDFQKYPVPSFDNIFVLVEHVQSGCNRNTYFKIPRLRTTVKDATAHDPNHVIVHFSCVVLRLRWVVELFRVVGTTENILLAFCRLGNSRISSFRKKVFNSPALSERGAKYVSFV